MAKLDASQATKIADIAGLVGSATALVLFLLLSDMDLARKQEGMRAIHHASLELDQTVTIKLS